MLRLILVLILLVVPAAAVSAQTDVSPSVYATVESGQMTRFDYIASAGSVHIANLLTLLFLSLWAMFLLMVFLMFKYRRQQ
jgi:hypothetical protein